MNKELKLKKQKCLKCKHIGTTREFPFYELHC